MTAKQATCKERQEATKSAVDALSTSLNDSQRYAMDLAQEKGASTWLTSLPLGFSLHKGAFRDALALHYGWLLSKVKAGSHCSSPRPRDYSRGMHAHTRIARINTCMYISAWIPRARDN